MATKKPSTAVQKHRALVKEVAGSLLAIATGSQKRKRGPISFAEGHQQALFAKRMAMDPRTRDLLWSATMTGVNLGIKSAAVRKRQGVRRGVPDFMLYEWQVEGARTREDFALFVPRVGLALEFKNPNGRGDVSLEQAAWLRGLKANGWQVAVVTTANEAWGFVADHLGFKP